jgi:integrase
MIPLSNQALEAVRGYFEIADYGLRDQPIFPRYGREGGREAISQNLNKIIRHKMKVSDPNLVSYSSRHTMKDKLRANRTPWLYQCDILGHSKPNQTAEGYGSGDPLVYLQQELERAAQVEDWGQEAELGINAI